MSGGLSIYIGPRPRKGKRRCVCCGDRFKLKRIVAALASADYALAFVCCACLPPSVRAEFDEQLRAAKHAARLEHA